MSKYKRVHYPVTPGMKGRARMAIRDYEHLHPDEIVFSVRPIAADLLELLTTRRPKDEEGEK